MSSTAPKKTTQQLLDDIITIEPKEFAKLSTKDQYSKFEPFMASYVDETGMKYKTYLEHLIKYFNEPDTFGLSAEGVKKRAIYIKNFKATVIPKNTSSNTFFNKYFEAIRTELGIESTDDDEKQDSSSSSSNTPQDITTLKKSVDEKTAELTSIKSDYAAMVEQEQNLLKDIETMKQKVAASGDTLFQLKKKLENEESKNKSLQQLQASVSQQTSAYNDATTSSSNLRSQLSTLQLQLNNEIEEQKAMEKEKANMQSKIDEIFRSKNILDQTLIDSETTLIKVSNELAMRNTQKEELSNKYLDAKEELDKTILALNELIATMPQINNKLIEARTKFIKLEQEKTRIDNNQNVNLGGYKALINDIFIYLANNSELTDVLDDFTEEETIMFKKLSEKAQNTTSSSSTSSSGGGIINSVSSFFGITSRANNSSSSTSSTLPINTSSIIIPSLSPADVNASLLSSSSSSVFPSSPPTVIIPSFIPSSSLNQLKLKYLILHGIPVS